MVALCRFISDFEVYVCRFQMRKTQQCAGRNNGKKVFLQENDGKENFVGFLKSVEYNNPGREKRKSEKCAQHSNRADGKILPRGNVR